MTPQEYAIIHHRNSHIIAALQHEMRLAIDLASRYKVNESRLRKAELRDLVPGTVVWLREHPRTPDFDGWSWELVNELSVNPDKMTVQTPGYTTHKIEDLFIEEPQ
jgi:hypothetical protein